MTTETPTEIEPRAWQDILGYIRSLEERVMKLEALTVHLASDKTKADLTAEGYSWGAPTNAYDTDNVACAEGTCPSCGHIGLDYEPWTRPYPFSYRAFAVCGKCGHREEF